MTPRELGFRMPAEWEPHQATWLAWPHNADSWPGKLAAILPVYAQMAAALARSERVYIDVNDAAMEASARRLLAQAGAGDALGSVLDGVLDGRIVFHHHPTNDAWRRDHGAIFVRRDTDENGVGSLAAIDWGYNAWGGKYPHKLDNQIPRQMADVLGVPVFDGGMILEGGSIDVDGGGLLLTTEACLLNPNRNPRLGRQQIEQRLRDFLGIETILWLGDGIVGDDTDGHIDDIARFVAPGVVVVAVEEDRADENYEPLMANWRRLEELAETVPGGLRLVRLPMPPAVVHEGQRLPASYVNFYIANRCVLLPGYDAKRDAQAAEVLAPSFPDREIITIDCRDLVWGLGAFHCLTQQVPAVRK